MGVDLKTLRPLPSVEGYSTTGGYSGRAVKPIALAKTMLIGKLIRDSYGGGRTLSGIGGVETGSDAAEFLLLGSNTVQAWGPPGGRTFRILCLLPGAFQLTRLGN